MLLDFLYWGMLAVTASLGLHVHTYFCIQCTHTHTLTQTGLVTSYALTGHLSGVSCVV